MQSVIIWQGIFVSHNFFSKMIAIILPTIDKSIFIYYQIKPFHLFFKILNTIIYHLFKSFKENDACC